MKNKWSKRATIIKPWLSAVMACCIGLLGSCVSIAPVNSSFESAKTLSKGETEFSGNYASYYVHAENTNGEKETTKVNNNLGLRVGYGLSDRFEVKVRYLRLFPVLQEDKDQVAGVNYLAFSPRYMIVKDHTAAGLDLGTYFYTAQDMGSASSFFLSPKLAFTLTPADFLDLTLNTKLHLLPSDGVYFWCVNLGAGISTNSGRFILQPEIGLTKDLENFSGGAWLNAGIGVAVRLNAGKTER